MRRFKRNPRLRRVLLACAAVIILIVGWYAIGRGTSVGRAVRLVDFGPGTNPTLNQHTAGERPIRVVAYNIAHGRGVGDSNWTDADTRSQRLRDIADLLRSFDADVVVLNEVDFSAVWSGHENQAALIAEAAGYRYRVEQVNIDVSLPFISLRFGNAVLSRHPIHHADLIDLPGYASWETLLGGKKRAVLCEIGLGEDARVRVVGAHFDTRGNESIRVESARAVLDMTEGSDSTVVLAGDLNSTLAGLPGARLDADQTTAVDVLIHEGGFSLAVPGGAIDQAAGTFPSWEPERTIDWVLVNGAGTLRRVEVADSDLSDHLPVVADIEMPAAAGAPTPVR